MATAVAMHGTSTSSSPLLVDDGECDSEVYDKLEDMVSSPSFLRALEEPASSRGRRQDHLFELAEQMATAVGTLDGPQPGSTAAAGSASAAAAVAQRDEFVVVSKEDAVEALAYYLAACIVKMPEAQALKPAELQQALVLTLKGLRKSKLQSACDLGRKVYRWSAFTYSAVQMYQNPWLVQAALAALWTFSRIAVRAAF